MIGFAIDLAGVHPSHRDRQSQAPRPRAARIEIDHALPLGDLRIVRVAMDHDAEARSRRIEVQLSEIVQDVEEQVVDFHDFGCRELIGPDAAIDVPANGEDGSEFPQGIDDPGKPMSPAWTIKSTPSRTSRPPGAAGRAYRK